MNGWVDAKIVAAAPQGMIQPGPGLHTRTLCRSMSATEPCSTDSGTQRPVVNTKIATAAALAAPQHRQLRLVETEED